MFAYHPILACKAQVYCVYIEAVAKAKKAISVKIRILYFKKGGIRKATRVGKLLTI